MYVCMCVCVKGGLHKAYTTLLRTQCSWISNVSSFDYCHTICAHLQLDIDS